MKKPKKLTIAVTIMPRTIAFHAFRDLTRNQLVAALKARKIPVPKLKDDMLERLANHVSKNRVPVTVTIG